MSEPSERSPFTVIRGGALPAELEQLRDECPVAKVRTVGGQPAWLVLGDAQARACFLDPRLTTSRDVALGTAPAVQDASPSLLNYDSQRHIQVRRLTAQALSARRIEALRPQIAGVAESLVRAIPQPGVVDLMAEFARPFAFGALCQAFGIAEATRPDLCRWMSLMSDHRDHPPQAFRTAERAVESVVRAELGRRREQPGDDPMSATLAAWQATGPLTEADLVQLHARLLRAGADSIAQMIGAAVVELLARPAEMTLLRTRRGSLPQVVEELLRWTTPGPFSTPRWATEDIVVDGVMIPRRSKVIMAVAAANRDPRTHEDASALHLAEPGSPRHLTFGLGSHFCPGAPLARLELMIALDTLLSAFPALKPAADLGELRWRGIHHRQLRELPVELA